MRDELMEKLAKVIYKYETGKTDFDDQDCTVKSCWNLDVYNLDDWVDEMFNCHIQLANDMGLDDVADQYIAMKYQYKTLEDELID